MKKLSIFAIFIAIGTLALALLNADRNTSPVLKNGEKKVERLKLAMKITSSVFQNNSKIPGKYTCDGQNINPPLEISEVPETAKSTVLIVDDPDAPVKIWVHWVVYNINPDATEVEEDSFPEGGIEGMTDFGRPGYGGPCPPSGTHRYFFKLYALDNKIELPQNATKQMVEEKMKDHILDKAELIGLYSRE